MYHFVLHIWIASQKNILIQQQSIDKDRNPVPGQPANKLSGALCRRGGKRKDSFELRLWNLNIDLHRKCRCEMLVGGDDVSNDIITPVFFLHQRSFPLRADWRKLDSSVDGEPQEHWRWNSTSRDVFASSPSFSRPAAKAPRRACSQVSTWNPEATAWNPKSKRPGLSWIPSHWVIKIVT